MSPLQSWFLLLCLLSIIFIVYSHLTRAPWLAKLNSKHDRISVLNIQEHEWQGLSLASARACVNCDYVHAADRCPRCGSTQHYRITDVLPAMQTLCEYAANRSKAAKAA